jgi:hypothetical protein
MCFGRLSRAPLHLLRLELNADTAHCEWIARSADAWDKDLPQGAAECNEAEQALDDAFAVRDLLFYALPSLATASFRVFRQPADERRELIITGTVSKPEPARYAYSLVMRAKLCGFEFLLNDGRLETLPAD